MKFSWSEVFNLFYTAKKYNVTHVETECRNFIKAHQTTPLNTLAILICLDTMGDEEELKKEVYMVMAE